MKLPYSYQQQFFAPVLLLSVIGHVVVVASGAGFLSFKPEYGVERAPSSMEVVIYKVEPEPKQKQAIQIFTASQHSEETVNIRQAEKPEVKKREAVKSIYVPPEKGALQRDANPYLKNPAPLYPALAREKGWEGVVLLSVFVQGDGNPGEVTVEKSSGYKILDNAAVSAVTKWRFKPARVGNMSFSSWVRIPIRFSLVDP
ncbi:MAG: energy transducer TonB [Candidatus Omnitrophica bacterium]|nr:energy transducer TonB [Candidatus Omnitrophota bacterium]